jgi:hypothetical protein
MLGWSSRAGVLVATAQSDTRRWPAGSGRALRPAVVATTGSRGVDATGSARLSLCIYERCMNELPYCGTR